MSAEKKAKTLTKSAKALLEFYLYNVNWNACVTGKAVETLLYVGFTNFVICKVLHSAMCRLYFECTKYVRLEDVKNPTKGLFYAKVDSKLTIAQLALWTNPYIPWL